ncbi:hypothetical protein THMIRHAS_02360 [Thiosulfatimonas sediminis]|uniref:Uncharacterized protein n=1 Tax=Thiosulfatimonas sediminis TaxID=2675054 RepID=A0A6F8PRV9_9GAMM|nr:hypothetical protein [Thiosulfatimonas sediminis]BBP44863.1 hypothetical protein THMIRHAS_02360 [Thiosulfatimonas sediminis]
MSKKTTLMLGLTAALLASAGHAADKSGKDPYLAGFEAYAKENPTLAPAIEAYKKDLQKAMQQNPNLVETKQELGHSDS